MKELKNLQTILDLEGIEEEGRDEAYEEDDDKREKDENKNRIRER